MLHAGAPIALIGDELFLFEEEVDMSILFGYFRADLLKDACPTAAAALLALSGNAIAGGPPANDTCVNAVDLNNAFNTISNPYSVMVDGTTATADSIFLPDFGVSVDFANGVWYTFTSPGPGYLVCSDIPHIGPNGLGTFFSLVDDCGTPSVIFGHELDPSFSNVFINGTASVYGFDSAGQTIKVLVNAGIPDAEIGPTSGMYDLTFEFQASQPPTNDDCANAVVIPSVP